MSRTSSAILLSYYEFRHGRATLTYKGCRIWERDRRDHPDEIELRPILPVVFYLGDGPWGHATEFSELLPAKVRAWLPRFEHLLIDQSGTPPEGCAVR